MSQTDIPMTTYSPDDSSDIAVLLTDILPADHALYFPSCLLNLLLYSLQLTPERLIPG